MGVRVTIGGDPVDDVIEYTISESSTPLAGGDSSGAVGTIDMTIGDGGEVPGVTEWFPTGAVRTNYIRNPRATGTLPDNTYAASGSASVSQVTDFPGAATAARFTRSVTGNQRIASITMGTTMPSAGQTVTFRARVRSVATLNNVTVMARVAVQSSAPSTNVTLGIISIPSGVSEMIITAPGLASAGGANAGITFIHNGGGIGWTLDFTDVMYEVAPSFAGYFDGSFPDDTGPGYTYAWLGAVDDSISTKTELVASATKASNFNALTWIEDEVEFLDTARGTSTGRVRDVSHDRAARTWSISGTDRLGEFMIEVQSQPFSGTLEAAFEYYCSLANIDSDIIVDDAIKSRPVNFPGFSGNLWNNMKMMATGQSADLNLISSVVVLRPIRAFKAIPDRETASSVSVSSEQLAQKQEVVWYDTERVPSGLIYPPGGWSRDQPSPLSVNAGETVETRLSIEASVTSVDQPTPQLSVSPTYDSSSVYTVIGDDNIVIPPTQWTDGGGSVTVSISEDTGSLIVTLVGAMGLYQANGTAMKTFRLALSADTGDSTYSTLRIVGDAVHLNEKSLILPTGVPAWRTAQEFAPTIDNPFLNTLEDAYTAGTRGARRYSGKSFGMSGSVVAINRRGERGSATYPSYADVRADWGGLDYAGAQSQNAGQSYAQVRQSLFDAIQDDFDNQLFGNVSGARFWDWRSARWYRIRNARTTWASTDIEADDDLIHEDVQEEFQGLNYADVQARFDGKSYFKANVLGLAS